MTRTPACLLVLVLVLVLLAAPAPWARAEDPPTPPVDPLVPAGDFRAAVDLLQQGIEAYRQPPEDAGLYDRRLDAWKGVIKPRVGRMVMRLKQLQADSLWIRTGAEGPAIAVAPDGWSPLVRGAASLFTELGTIVARYRDVRLDPKHARDLWIHRNPKPDPIEPTPTEPALAELNGLIARYIRLGHPVPAHLLRERAEYASIVAAEQAAAREQKRREYELRKEQAYQAIESRVRETRGLLERDSTVFEEQMHDLQALLAGAQELEERQLRQQVEAAQAGGAKVEDAAPLLAALAAGRLEGTSFRDPRSARYGSVLRQKWMTPRSKLLKAIDRASAPEPKKE